ncbi:hypothetical protein, partial [Lonsdalea quercina]|uniref:hypothetical protein n=1 Tax=Lonsdalea quercina TaxID=71657 RepID=UPI00397671B2
KLRRMRRSFANIAQKVIYAGNCARSCADLAIVPHEDKWPYNRIKIVPLAVKTGLNFVTSLTHHTLSVGSENISFQALSRRQKETH